MRSDGPRTRRTAALVLAGAGLLTGCVGARTPDVRTTTVPPGATFFRRPSVAPLPPDHRLGGFPYGTYVMARPLPDRSPGTGRAYALTMPLQRRALDLAGALGFGDGPVEFGGNPWTVTRGQATLRIWPDSGGRWSYQRQTGGDGLPPRDPGERRAFALARPILRASGLDRAEARHERGQVIVEPRIGNRPTWGWETRIQLDGDGVSNAAGWLGPARGGTERPILSAAESFTRLQREAAHPRWSVKGCPAAYGATPPCPMRNPSPDVTGARFAYALDWGAEGNGPRLVPAWLFTRRGNGELIAYPA
ncbi:hypothetical protein [Actinomadura fibrosa]|uniref:Lipoprotein n=1 Tax=Actinomadura fibrosa TaxID=111802 RepID=A0ABW2XTN0_9ACTN|nr:hypothetical protein [Actinomadura fibrosa]